MTIDAFDHYTIRCANLDASWRFYEKALGLHVIDRPFPGGRAAKVQIGDLDVVHMFQATPEQDSIFGRMEPRDEETRSWRTGRLQHVGFWAKEHRAMKARLDEMSIPFHERTLPDKHQLVMRDPDDIEIEVNFPLSEVQAGASQP